MLINKLADYFVPIKIFRRNSEIHISAADFCVIHSAVSGAQKFIVKGVFHIFAQAENIAGKALNLSLKNKDEIIKNCKIIIGVVSDTAEIDKKLEKLSKELETIAVSVSEYVKRNATEIVSQDDYIKEYTKLTGKYEKKVKQKEKLIAEKEDKLRRTNEIKLYVQKMIETQSFITEWDDTLWALFLDVATVNTDGTIEYQFKDGSKISV